MEIGEKKTYDDEEGNRYGDDNETNDDDDDDSCAGCTYRSDSSYVTKVYVFIV